MGTYIMPTTAVIYIDRASNNPIHAKKFMNSLIKHAPWANAGDDYIHILKGFDEKIPDYLNDYCQIDNPEIFHVSDELRPIEAIMLVAKQLVNDNILIFNSYSRILADNWLKIYEAAFTPGVGIVGASASNENHPHIRSNAFMINRRLFIELASGIKTREDDLEFESGKNNLTQQLFDKGLKALVVDKNGQAWNNWHESRTFRKYNQEDLLVGDNRTADYMMADTRTRQYLSKLTYGYDHDPMSVTTKQRINSYLEYHYDL